MKAMADSSANLWGASVGEAAESAAQCEGGFHLQERRAARGSVSGLRVLGLRGAPESGFGGRGSHLEQRPSEVV